MTTTASGLRNAVNVATAAFAHNAEVGEILGRIQQPEQLIRFLHRYTLYNGNFAGGVAMLAGCFHLRQDLFRDPDEPIHACADRSARIASMVFFAAEDEYSDRDDHTRITHRDLGQSVLKATVEHFAVDADSFNSAYPLHPTTIRALATVLEGYCTSTAPTEDDLFRGLGFHIASETSADQEFAAITAYLRAAQPTLVECLATASTHLGQTAYRWLDLHTVVEVEHHQYALQAADLAVKYYSGNASQDRLRDLLVEGVARFQASFQGLLAGILDPA